MTALNFPSNPTVGQIYAAPNGIQYVYDGVKWSVENIASTSEAVTNSVQDRVAPMFVDGDNQGITFAYNAETNTISSTVTSTVGDKLVNGSKELSLNVDGTVSLPPDGFIKNSDGGIVSLGYNNGKLVVGSNLVRTPVQITMGGLLLPTYTWTFDEDGILRLPEGGDIVDNAGTSVLGGGNASTGDVEFTGSALATPNTTEIDWPNGVIRLAPGSVSNPDLAAYGQFLNIYPTTAFDAPHIHIAAGSGVNGKGDLLLGDDNQNIDVNNAGYITVKSYDPIRGQQNLWSFDKDGTLYGPGMGTVITNAISGASGNDLFLSGGNNNVRQSRVVRFTDADGTAKSIYTVDTNIYYVDDISFTNGQPTLWIAPNENASIASITPGVGTATFDFGNAITLLADTDYTIDWYSVNNVTSVTIQSTIRQSNSYTRTTAPSSVSTPSVIWTGTDDWISSAKLTIQVEANELLDPTGWHTQVCEAIIVSRGNNGEPDITVYGVTHTSVNPLMTFTAQRNVTTNLIEIVGTPTATVDGQAYLRIHSVEMLSRD